MIKTVLFSTFAFVLGISVGIGIFTFLHTNSTLIHTPYPTTKFSLENPPDQSIKGMITSLSGDIFWQSRTASSGVAIAKPQPLQQGEEVDTGKNGQVSISFSDVASISAHPDTQLNIVQTLPANMIIQQKKGTASYVKEKAAIPFSVRGLDLLLTFTEGENTIAVDDSKRTITVVVTKGSLTAAYTDTDNTTQVLTLPAGKRLNFTNDTKTAVITH